MDFVSAKEESVKGVDQCIKAYCERHHLDKVILHAWKVEIVKAIDDRIREVTPRLKFDPVSETLKDPFCRKNLKELQHRFVISPIDKATGNIALICKRFYAEVLVKELGLVGEKSETYQPVKKKNSNIIETHKKDLKNKFGIAVPKENEKLPNIYWLPKLHKNPKIP